MTRKALTAVAGALLLGLVLAGCGAGKDAATAETQPSIRGVNADKAGIAIRNAMVAFDPEGYPAGADAPIELTVLNDTSQQVSLTQASSTAAASVEIEEDVRLAPGDYVTASLQATGLSSSLTGASVLPMELTFSNGTELALQLPVATPEQPLPRTPMEFEDEEH